MGNVIIDAISELIPHEIALENSGLHNSTESLIGSNFLLKKAKTDICFAPLTNILPSTKQSKRKQKSIGRIAQNEIKEKLCSRQYSRENKSVEGGFF